MGSPTTARSVRCCLQPTPRRRCSIRSPPASTPCPTSGRFRCWLGCRRSPGSGSTVTTSTMPHCALPTCSRCRISRRRLRQNLPPWDPMPGSSTLIHRGPDQLGVYQSPICSMGATRLKIIDLEHGDQPIATEDGNAVVVFNGEIYNHLEVRAELEKLGHRFHTHCDTETVLRAFLEWDTQCFRRLRGMFAVALWTNSTRRLVLARDRVGIKPLYIAHRGEEIF